MQLSVRGSELNDFLRCRLRWKYRWVDGLKAKKPNGKLFFGNLFHKFVEHYYQTKDYNQAIREMRKLFDESNTDLMEQHELDDLWTTAINVVENYVKKWGDVDKSWKVIATELKFEIPLDDNVMYEGTIDLVYINELGQLWFSDHKTTASLEKYDKNAEMDRQISRYYWALQQIAKGKGFVYDKKGNRHPATVFAKRMEGKSPYGFVYNVILRDYPKPPKKLQKGGLSKDKAQKTSYELYLDALVENGFIDKEKIVAGNLVPISEVPEEYQEMLQMLADQEQPNGNRYFRRVEVIRLQEEINAAIEEFYYTATDMAEQRHRISQERGNVYRNITADCHWDCEFKELCLATMSGGNADHILESMYEKESEQHEKVSTV